MFEAIIAGARNGVLAAATVVTFCAVLLVFAGVYVAITEVLDRVAPEDEPVQEMRHEDDEDGE